MLFCFFFFQAEDGIRDKLVTGVQTCALPIYLHAGRGHGEGLELEAFLDREVFEDRDRLTARRVVVEEEADLLALEVAAELVLDELHGRSGLRPVRRGDRKEDRKSTRLNSSH